MFLFKKKAVDLELVLYQFGENFLMGFVAPPEKGSPCIHCLELWFTRRKINYERLKLSDFPQYERFAEELSQDKNPAIFYEINQSGFSQKLELAVFPHPLCGCDKTSAIWEGQSEKLYHLFTPVESLKAARFGTDQGNLWLAKAEGHLFTTLGKVTATGLGATREDAKKQAFQRFLVRWVELEGSQWKPDGIADAGQSPLVPEVTEIQSHAIGADIADAKLNAFLDYAKKRTFQNYARNLKKPILLTDMEPWVRAHAPSFVYKQYDLYLFFYPNSTPSWVLGLMAISRISSQEKPVFLLESGLSLQKTLIRLIQRCIEFAKPLDSYQPSVLEKIIKSKREPTLNQWWLSWIYSCAKLSVSDVVTLPEYGLEISPWLDYFSDGQERVAFEILEDSKVCIRPFLGVRLKAEKPIGESYVDNVRGIGSRGSFQSILQG